MLSVLTGGRRRRRRTPPALVAVLALVAALAGAVAAYRSHGTRTPPAHVAAGVLPAHAPPPRPRPAAARPVARSPLLEPRAPLFAHELHPTVRARSAILVDATSGRVLWARKPHASVPIASTTKIMTATLALERLDPRERVVVPRKVLRIPLVREGLRPGEHVAAWKLLDGLLIYSGNDDAYTLATAVAGSRNRFVALMNEKARELGMRDTHFTTPSGVIDRGNRSSAWDMAGLARYALRDARFRSIVKTRIAHVRWSAPTYEKVYVNKNALLGSYPGADGVKTGWTTIARHCLVASARRRGVHLVAVVLGSENAFAAAARLLDFGFAHASALRATAAAG